MMASASLTQYLVARNQQHKMLLSEAVSSPATEMTETWPESPVTHLRPGLGLKFVHPLQAGFPRFGVVSRQMR